jgi:hypothetical protein
MVKEKKLKIEKINFLNRYTRGAWKINSHTGLVDIEGDFSFKDLGTSSMRGIKFGTVTGNFDCSFNRLKTLRGCPLKVGGNFLCSGNPISNLKGAPLEIGGHFEFMGSTINSLEGLPKRIGDGFCLNDIYIASDGYTSLLGYLKKSFRFVSI